MEKIKTRRKLASDLRLKGFKRERGWIIISVCIRFADLAEKKSRRKLVYFASPIPSQKDNKYLKNKVKFLRSSQVNKYSLYALQLMAFPVSVNLTFKIHYAANFSEAVYLLGSSKKLGSWDLQSAVRLEWNTVKFKH